MVEANEEHLKYLDKLREAGDVNMLGSTPYLQQEFDLPRLDAKHIVNHWLDTYVERHPEEMCRWDLGKL